LSLEDLLEIFELAIPPADRDLNGAVYTPAHIADFMCQRAITRGDEVVADISCGAGAFLLGAVRRCALYPAKQCRPSWPDKSSVGTFYPIPSGTPACSWRS